MELHIVDEIDLAPLVDDNQDAERPYKHLLEGGRRVSLEEHHFRFFRSLLLLAVVEDEKVLDVSFAQLQATRAHLEIGIDLAVDASEVRMSIAQELPYAALVGAAGFDFDVDVVAHRLTSAVERSPSVAHGRLGAVIPPWRGRCARGRWRGGARSFASSAT